MQTLLKITDLTRELNIDFSKIERYAQKGLIIFKNTNNGDISAGPVELARLRFIMKAEELGYSLDNINRLVGHAYSVLRSDNPLESSRSFAENVFKALETDLKNQDPLEQLNTKCDLRLLTDYLAELKNIKDLPAEPEPEKPAKSIKTPAKPKHLKKVAPKSKVPEKKPATEIPGPTVEKTKSGRWMLYLGLVTLAAIVGVFFLFNKNTGEKISRDTKSSIFRHAEEQSPPAITKEKSFPVPKLEPTVEIAESAPEKKTPPAPEQPEQPIVLPQPVVPDLRELGPLAPQPLPPADTLKTESEVKPAAQSSEPEKTEVTDNTAQVQVDAIFIKGFNLTFLQAEKTYTASFQIIKNKDFPQDKIAGYTFVLLQAGSDRIIPIPEVNLANNLPSDYRRGNYFSIARLKDQKTSLQLDILPDQISSATVIVYSASGSILKSEKFKPRIKVIRTSPIKTEKPQPKRPDKSSGQPRSRESGNNQAVRAKTPISEEAVKWESKSYNLVLKGKYAEAITAASRAIKLDPGRINPYINRSLAYIEMEMYIKAIRDCDKVLMMDPGNALAYNNRGLSYHRMGKMDQARTNYKKACHLGLELGCKNLADLEKENRIVSLLEASRKAFLARDWSSVIKYTTEVINLDPSNSVAFTNRSAAYAEKGRLNKALKDSMQALQIDPSFPLAYNNRGYVYELMGKTKKATADYLKSCSLGFDLGCENLARLGKSP